MPVSKSYNPLLQVLVEHFDWEELRTICFELGIDYDNLRGENKVAQARELILYAQRHNLLSRLIDTIVQQRPEIASELAHKPLSVLQLPDGFWSNWWEQFRRSPLVVQFVLGVVILIGIVLLGLVAYKEIRSALPVDWFPDVAPAKDNENLILVSAFRGTGALLPEQRINRTLKTLIAYNPKLNARVDLVIQRMIASETEAKIWGKQHNAKIVIWGWYDTEVQVMMTFPSSPGILPVDDIQSMETPKTFASTQKFDQVMAEQVELVSQIALGWIAHLQGADDSALELWGKVIKQTEALPLKEKRNLRIDELLVWNGVILDLFPYKSSPVDVSLYSLEAKINREQVYCIGIKIH